PCRDSRGAGNCKPTKEASSWRAHQQVRKFHFAWPLAVEIGEAMLHGVLWHPGFRRRADAGCASVHGEVIADYLTTFHYEPNLLECADISDRISCNGDEVGKLPGLHSAYPVLPAQHLGGVARDRAQDVERRHSGLAQMAEHESASLAARLARVGPAHIGSRRKFHAGLQYSLREGHWALPGAGVGHSLLGFHRGRHHD